MGVDVACGGLVGVSMGSLRAVRANTQSRRETVKIWNKTGRRGFPREIQQGKATSNWLSDGLMTRAE